MKHFLNIIKIFIISLFSALFIVNISHVVSANVVEKPVAKCNIDLNDWYTNCTSKILYEPIRESYYKVSDEISFKENKTSESNVSYISFLKQNGYYKNDSQDENLNMRNAVLRFQSNCNLTVDGIFGPITEAAFKKSLDGFKYNDSVNVAPVQNYWITINKTNRILTLYYGFNVIKKYPIATGTNPSLTPEGKFSIVNKEVDPYWSNDSSYVPGGSPDNPLGHRWMGLSVGGGNAYGIHGNNSPYSIGTNASHGCIRMINSDVEQLYDIIPINTPVWIGTTEELESWGVKQPAY